MVVAFLGKLDKRFCTFLAIQNMNMYIKLQTNKTKALASGLLKECPNE